MTKKKKEKKTWPSSESQNSPPWLDVLRVRKILRSIFHIIFMIFLVFSLVFIIAFVFSTKIQSFLYFPGAYMNTLGKDDFYNEKFPDSWEKIYFDVEKQEVFWVYIENDADETIYFFHGNGGDLRYFQEAIEIYLSWGYNVLALEYPWYADLPGYPTAKNVSLAAEKLYILAKEKYKLTDETTFVWGYSIGTGVASDFVKNSYFPVLVLESPYTSWYDLAKDKLGFIPQKYLWIDNVFNTEKNLQSYSWAVLVVHGEKDELIPVLHSYRLQELEKDNITTLIDDAWDHYNLLRNPDNNSKIEYFLENKELDLEKYKAEQELTKLRETISLDIEDDSSYTKYVDPNVSFQDVWYIPQDLRKLERTHLRDIKWDAQLREEAATRFEELAWSFYTYFWEKIDVVSSYRSYRYQAWIKSRGCPDHLCAKAGHSEHQSWLAIDLWSASTLWEWQQSPRLQSYYNWLWRNAHFYGWHNPYRKWVDIDGYDPEPWHWRYLWVDLAGYLYEHNVTFAEYYKARQRQL